MKLKLANLFSTAGTSVVEMEIQPPDKEQPLATPVQCRDDASVPGSPAARKKASKGSRGSNRGRGRGGRKSNQVTPRKGHNNPTLPERPAGRLPAHSTVEQAPVPIEYASNAVPFGNGGMLLPTIGNQYDGFPEDYFNPWGTLAAVDMNRTAIINSPQRHQTQPYGGDVMGRRGGRGNSNEASWEYPVDQAVVGLMPYFTNPNNPVPGYPVPPSIPFLPPPLSPPILPVATSTSLPPPFFDSFHVTDAEMEPKNRPSSVVERINNTFVIRSPLNEPQDLTKCNYPEPKESLQPTKMKKSHEMRRQSPSVSVSSKPGTPNPGGSRSRKSSILRPHVPPDGAPGPRRNTVGGERKNQAALAKHSRNTSNVSTTSESFFFPGRARSGSLRSTNTPPPHRLRETTSSTEPDERQPTPTISSDDSFPKVRRLFSESVGTPHRMRIKRGSSVSSAGPKPNSSHGAQVPNDTVTEQGVSPAASSYPESYSSQARPPFGRQFSGTQPYRPYQPGGLSQAVPRPTYPEPQRNVAYHPSIMPYGGQTTQRSQIHAPQPHPAGYGPLTALPQGYSHTHMQLNSSQATNFQGQGGNHQYYQPGPRHNPTLIAGGFPKMPNMNTNNQYQQVSLGPQPYTNPQQFRGVYSSMGSHFPSPPRQTLQHTPPKHLQTPPTMAARTPVQPKPSPTVIIPPEYATPTKSASGFTLAKNKDGHYLRYSRSADGKEGSMAGSQFQQPNRYLPRPPSPPDIVKQCFSDGELLWPRGPFIPLNTWGVPVYTMESSGFVNILFTTFGVVPLPFSIPYLRAHAEILKPNFGDHVVTCGTMLAEKDRLGPYWDRVYYYRKIIKAAAPLQGYKPWDKLPEKDWPNIEALLGTDVGEHTNVNVYGSEPDNKRILFRCEEVSRDPNDTTPRWVYFVYVHHHGIVQMQYSDPGTRDPKMPSKPLDGSTDPRITPQYQFQLPNYVCLSESRGIYAHGYVECGIPAKKRHVHPFNENNYDQLWYGLAHLQEVVLADDDHTIKTTPPWIDPVHLYGIPEVRWLPIRIAVLGQGKPEKWLKYEIFQNPYPWHFPAEAYEEYEDKEWKERVRRDDEYCNELMKNRVRPFLRMEEHGEEYG